MLLLRLFPWFLQVPKIYRFFRNKMCGSGIPLAIGSLCVYIRKDGEDCDNLINTKHFP